MFLTLYSAIRREYLKARARKLRWGEEVHLLREEMRRVLRFLNWRVRWWQQRTYPGERDDDAVSEGLKAYALRQAALHRSLLASFEKTWSQTAVQAAREAADIDVHLAETFIQD